MSHCKDCEHFAKNEGLNWPLYGECEATGFAAEGEPLVFPLGYEIEGLAVHRDFGCVQFEPKEQ